MRRRSAIGAGTLAMSLLALPMRGQVPANPSGEIAPEVASESGSFGLGNQDYWVSASKFAPVLGGFWITDPFLYLQSSGGNSFGAQVELPAGAVIAAITCHFYDDDVTLTGTIRLYKMSYDQSTQTPSVSILGPSITSMDTGGYHVVTESYNETVRYRQGTFVQNFYVLALSLPSSNELRFRGCRMVWHRQVSAPPGSATFADVPMNHPYFQFIEALVDSGVTAGCGGGLYCVNAPITRGEMAVFLAAALGLHFPN